MAKTKIEFVCRECGASHYQWAGQCLECKAWNTLEEVVISQVTSSRPESLKDLPSSTIRILRGLSTYFATLAYPSFNQNRQFNKKICHKN